MQKVRIVTDSAADLPKAVREAEGIAMLPMQITFGDEEFRDGVDLSAAEFYRRLREGNILPKTAQPLVAEVEKVFRELTADGSSLVVLHMSSGLSGTYATSLMLAEELKAKGADIHVVDSLSASLGQGLLVLSAARMARQGATSGEIVADLARRIPRINHLFILDTIEYLLKGGRITKTEAVLGTILDVKPQLYINNEGRILVKAKVRGRKRSIAQLLEEVGKRLTDPSRQTVGVVHADCPDEAGELVEQVRQRFAPAEIITSEMTATVGTHVGPGLLGVVFESDLGRG